MTGLWARWWVRWRARSWARCGMGPGRVVPARPAHGAGRRRRAAPVIGALIVLAAAALTGCTGSTEPAGSAAAPSVRAGATSSGPTSSVAPSRTGVVADAEVLKQLPYASRSPTQALHLSLPVRTGAAVPLVVLVHGGGFYEGDKGDVRFLVEALNARGYATAAIDYRLSGEALFPAAVQDVTSAIRWVRANAAVHGIDPDRIAVWGLSAGGNLAAMAALTADRGTLTDPDTGPQDSGDPFVTGAVQAVLAWYAPMDFATMDAQSVDPGGCPGQPDLHDPAGSPESRFLGAPLAAVPELVRSAAPATYLAGAAGGVLADGTPIPPFLLVHGDRDCTVPYAQSLEFADAVRAAGGSAQVNIVAGAGHAVPEIDRTQVRSSIDFLDTTLGR